MLVGKRLLAGRTPGERATSRRFLATKGDLRGAHNVPPGPWIDIAVSMHHSISMRTTVTLDDDVFEAARALVQASGRTLGQILSQLARRGLRVQSEHATKNGLPVFDVSVNAPVIPSSRAADLIADEPS